MDTIPSWNHASGEKLETVSVYKLVDGIYTRKARDRSGTVRLYRNSLRLYRGVSPDRWRVVPLYIFVAMVYSGVVSNLFAGVPLYREVTVLYRKTVPLYAIAVFSRAEEIQRGAEQVVTPTLSRVGAGLDGWEGRDPPCNGETCSGGRCPSPSGRDGSVVEARPVTARSL
ncbi:MAG TPA: hypothetical protein VIA62_27545 [Thermoanaerobaculia bacterium]|nr:hypothetical protein [Thermoanaerobaculia bacterium]